MGAEEQGSTASHGSAGARERRSSPPAPECSDAPPHPGTRAPMHSPAEDEAVDAVIEAVLQASGAWPAFAAALREPLRQAAGHPWRQFPLLCCRAVGGDSELGIVVAAAFELARVAADLLDDVEDADTGAALWQSLGAPQAINVGTSLIFASLLALSRLREHGVSPERLALLQTEFARTGFRMCAGQHLDLCGGAEGQRGRGEEENSPPLLRSSAPLHEYWRIVAAKSGAFFELGCRAGALLGDVDAGGPRNGDVAPYAEFGRHLGVLVQITNDLAGLLALDGSSDLATRKPTLPVLYAFSVATDTQADRLRRAWASAARDPATCHDIQSLVVELGAPQYILMEAERHARLARQALDRAKGQPDALAQLAELLDRHRPTSLLDEGRLRKGREGGK